MIRPTTSDIGKWRWAPHVDLRSLCAAAAVVLALSVPASAQQAAGTQKVESGVQWDDGSIRFGESVRIDEETKTVTDVPLGEEDDCDNEAAYQQADGLPCEQLTVVTGSYLESI